MQTIEMGNNQGKARLWLFTNFHAKNKWIEYRDEYALQQPEENTSCARWIEMKPLVCQAASSGEAAAQLKKEKDDQRRLQKAKKYYALGKIEKAAEFGMKRAQLKMAEKYFYGEEVPEDIPKAVLWAQAASRNGDLEAKFLLATCHLRPGMHNNETKACSLFQEAASQGHVRAVYYLALCYKNGVGAEVNNVRAAELFREAASKGVTEAQRHVWKTYWKLEEEVDTQTRTEAAREYKRQQAREVKKELKEERAKKQNK